MPDGNARARDVGSSLPVTALLAAECLCWC
jgi:hypothetical protein